MENGREQKKICRVCGRRVPRLYKGLGGGRCASCLHRTHAGHLAENRRVCLACREEEMIVPGEYLGVPHGITMVHLADPHFGGGDTPWRTRLLKEWLSWRKPDYVLISGDLTMRAGRDDYMRAAEWIGEVESAGPRLAVVPGNHDIGYWGNAKSLGRQVAGRKYHRWINIIDRPFEPCLRGPGFVAVGLNSAHGTKPGRLFNGYLTVRQVARAADIFRSTPEIHLKAAFCHHPLVRFKNNTHRALQGAAGAREDLAGSGASLFLWGHQHSFSAAEMAGPAGKYYAVQGPTLSGRVRGGDYPGFSVVEWLFNDRVIIRAYNVINGSTVEEAERVEYRLQGGTAPGNVE